MRLWARPLDIGEAVGVTAIEAKRESGNGAPVEVNVGKTVEEDGDAVMVDITVGDAAGEAGGEAGDGAFMGDTGGCSRGRWA